MHHGSGERRNLRDALMFATPKRIMEHVGLTARSVVRAQDSHIGDARVTDTGVNRGELSIGRPAFG